ncbi:hypothetical protein HAX54_044546 [Datura stramonium]|uniref:Uncharacterized protein n=1 Tax=Datura stramonium TaxID=4076 RepID=A0ABS8SPA3_DATST|nr:hypothetical protein [Datura stramonium]
MEVAGRGPQVGVKSQVWIRFQNLRWKSRSVGSGVKSRDWGQGVESRVRVGYRGRGRCPIGSESGLGSGERCQGQVSGDESGSGSGIGLGLVSGSGIGVRVAVVRGSGIGCWVYESGRDVDFRDECRVVFEGQGRVPGVRSRSVVRCPMSGRKLD